MSTPSSLPDNPSRGREIEPSASVGLPRSTEVIIQQVSVAQRDPRPGELWCQLHGFTFGVDGHGEPRAPGECAECFAGRKRRTD